MRTKAKQDIPEVDIIDALPAEVKGPRDRLTQAQLVTRARMPFPVTKTVADALALVEVF